MLTRLIAIAIGMLLLATVNAQSLPDQVPERARSFGVGEPRALLELPAGVLLERVQALPLPARQRALQWLQSFSFPGVDVDKLRADPSGGIYYRDDAVPPQHVTGTEEPSPAFAEGITSADVLFLHSKPGAANVVFLDFDGHLISGTAWNGSGATLHARPYDIDGDPGTFGIEERENIAAIWHRVAEDFAPFDIDVTTEAPSQFTATTGHVLITRDEDATNAAMPSKGAGGVAYVNVWGRTGSYDYQYYSPALVYYDNLGNGQARYVAEAASHELGHNLALSHDGTSSVSYYAGHNAGPAAGYIDWAPIMGNSYGADVSQWSRGDYAGANNQQDDLAVIAQRLSYQGDDHSDVPASATALVADAAGNVISTNPEIDPYNEWPDNKGIIEHNQDTDYFVLDLVGGAVDLTVTPAWDAFYHDASRGANLDVHAALYSASGALIAEDDPFTDTDARITVNVAGGIYYLVITATAPGDPVTAYDDYASSGLYYINGTVPVGTPNSGPTANNDVGTLDEDTTVVLSVLVNDTDPEGDLLSIAALTQPSHGTAGGDGTMVTYTPAANYAGPDSFTYVVTDGYSTDSATVSLTVQPVNDPPSAASDTTGTHENIAVAIDVLANDADVDGDTLSIVGTTTAENGTVTHDAGMITYTPAPGFAGTDGFQYSVSDGHGGLDSATVTVSVNSIATLPDPPVGLTATDSGQGSALVAWQEGIDVTGHEVQRETQHKKRGVWQSTTSIASVTTGVSSLEDPSGAGTFRYRLRAFNESGFSIWSGWVEVVVTDASGGGKGGGNGGGKGARGK